MRRLLPFLSLFVGAPLAQISAADGATVVEAGFPALNRPWSGDDYQRVAQVLATGKVSAPLLSTEEGRLFIERLTSTENLAIYRDRSVPIDQRMDSFFKTLQSVGAISQRYLVAANRQLPVLPAKLPVQRELALQVAFLLRASAAGVPLINESLPILPRDDKYARHMEGRKQAHANLAGMFSAAVGTLSELGIFTPETDSLLLEAMAETLPTFKPIFTPDIQLQTRKKLKALRPAFLRPEDAKLLQRLIDGLGG